MRYPTTLTQTAQALDMPRYVVIEQLEQAGLIHRDPLMDNWRASNKGIGTNRVTERHRRIQLKGTTVERCYAQLMVTAEGRRWLKQRAADQAA